MILAILGTEQFSFDRFVKCLDRLIEEGVLKEDVFVQLGSSHYEPRLAKFKRFLPFGEMRDLITQASLVVSHAGAGTTLLCLQLGKKPILFPRDPDQGEHVDGHQRAFAEKMREKGHILLAHDYGGLRSAILMSKDPAVPPLNPNPSELVAFLRGL